MCNVFELETRQIYTRQIYKKQTLATSSAISMQPMHGQSTAILLDQKSHNYLHLVDRDTLDTHCCTKCRFQGLMQPANQQRQPQ